MKDLTHVLAVILNQPLLALPTAAMTVYNVLAGKTGLSPGDVPTENLDHFRVHFEAMQHRPIVSGPNRTEFRGEVESSRFTGGRTNSTDGNWNSVEPFLLTKDGTAIISVTGSLVNRGAWVGASSGITSYEGIDYQLERAAKYEGAKSILLDISSPGGEAMGNAELADKIMKIRAVKPVYGIANSMAASAGFCILAACTEAYSTKSALTGSIGCIMLHMDMTEQAAMAGVKPTLITAGARKADGHPLTALTAEARQELMAGVLSYYELFTEAVAKGRGPKLTKKMARDTEARTYVGKDAVAAGLVDDIGSFMDVLDASDRANRRGASKSNGSRGNTMSILNSVDASVAANAPALAQAAAPAPAPAQQAGFDPRVSAIIDSAALRAQPHLLGPALDLARNAPSMSADDVVSFVSRSFSAPAAAAPPAPPAPAPAPAAANGGMVYVQGHGWMAPVASAAPPAPPAPLAPAPAMHGPGSGQAPTIALAAQAEQSGVNAVSGAGAPQAAGEPNAPGLITLENAPWSTFTESINNERARSFRGSYIDNRG